ncbi:triple tyrosine motif-containing protein [Algoriphagus sp. CAU 1675]|uniref:triple tyrosine motif-containing protein n=1 Tax=Algoriphagus sp. CAU 1675 TaxID=3032597 RepID=UPI0023DB5201|nr:triple tyrosine motif-containing protein [Algoriphagus sp. CAU 1675]MDF2158798.1 triple tyrosine motif-containing protein [Algoriphagus sp. CAU 1675]
MKSNSQLKKGNFSLLMNLTKTKIKLNSKVVIFLIGMILSVNSLSAQNSGDFQGLPFITNYEASTYKAGIQNWDIIQDNAGRLFVANNLGLLEFDGKSWNRYGLNNTKVRSAFFGIDGKIYVGSQADFGYLSSDETGQLQYTSLADSLPSSVRDFDETWKVFGVGNQIYFCTFKRIYSYDGREIKVIDSDRRLDISFQVDNLLYTQISDSGLFQIKPEGFELIRNGDFFKDKRISNILNYEQDQWLITTFSHGAYLYDGTIKPFPLSEDFWKDEFLINYSTRLKNGNIALGTQNAGIFVLDKGGNLVLHLDKNSGLMDLTINYIYEDEQQNLWLAMNNGVARIDLHSPFTKIDNRMGISGAGYAALKKDKEFYLGTNNGLFVWKDGKTDFVKGSAGQVYSVQDINGKVILGHHNGTFLIENQQARKISEEQGAWILKPIPNRPNFFIQGTYTGLNLFEWKNESLAFIKKIQGFNESSRVMEFDGNTLWVAHGYKGVFKIRFNEDYTEVIERKLYNSAQGFPNDVLINVYKISNRLIFTANGGFYGYELNSDYFKPLNEFNDLFGYGTVMADMEADDIGNLYFIEQTKLGVIKPQSNHKLKVHSTPFNKIRSFWNDDLANIIALDNQNILIGGKQGFIHYRPQLDIPNSDKPKIIFREISNWGKENKLLFAGHKKELEQSENQNPPSFSFSQNSFSFDYVAPHFESGDEILYQYKLENFDEDWSTWTAENKKGYTNLREGDYIFRVRAKTIFDDVTEEIEFPFQISPPFYRTYVAYLIYGGSIFSILMVGFKWLDRRHKSETKQLELEKNKALKRKDNEIESLTQKSEREIMALKNAKLQADVELKNQELTSSAMHLIQKNQLLTTVKNSLKTLAKDEKAKLMNSQLNRLIKSIDKDLEGGQEWSQFAENFDQVHGNFITRLKERYPELTPQEIKFSAYIRMNLNTKEIANLLGISVRGVEIGRYRVRKKLGLTRKDNLSDFLLRF